MWPSYEAGMPGLYLERLWDCGPTWLRIPGTFWTLIPTDRAVTFFNCFEPKGTLDLMPYLIFDRFPCSKRNHPNDAYALVGHFYPHSSQGHRPTRIERKHLEWARLKMAVALRSTRPWSEWPFNNRQRSNGCSQRPESSLKNVSHLRVRWCSTV